MDGAGIGASSFSKAELKKQIKLEEQKKVDEKTDLTKNKDDLEEGEDRRKKGRVNRWINYAMSSLAG
ncbi:hypothetical protein ACET3X_001274 [Alternaria dauci]|uniref:Uncharacterized protein n=1 Tax=Alternaria dauci TaxID=48095 RepID=A0ABR3UWU1_9PLEO